MDIRDSQHPPMPIPAERKQRDIQRATSHLISTVQNTCDPANQQSPRDRAARHSALRQAVIMALSTTLSCTPNREARSLLNDQDHHLLEMMTRRSRDLAVSAADYAFDETVTANLLTMVHSSSQGLNWQDHQQQAPLTQTNIILTAIEGTIQTARKAMNAAMKANVETIKAAFITTSPHYTEFRDALEKERTTYNAALSQAKDPITKARQENLQKLRAVMPQAGQPE